MSAAVRLQLPQSRAVFFLDDLPPTEIYTLSLHDALPILGISWIIGWYLRRRCVWPLNPLAPDRKSTRLNSSHTVNSYAVFCLKKKQQVRLEPNATFNGTFTFAGTETGSDFADFLLGVPSN